MVTLTSQLRIYGIGKNIISHWMRLITEWFFINPFKRGYHHITFSILMKKLFHPAPQWADLVFNSKHRSDTAPKSKCHRFTQEDVLHVQLLCFNIGLPLHCSCQLPHSCQPVQVLSEWKLVTTRQSLLKHQQVRTFKVPPVGSVTDQIPLIGSGDRRYHQIRYWRGISAVCFNTTILMQTARGYLYSSPSLESKQSGPPAAQHKQTLGLLNRGTVPFWFRRRT